MAEKKSYKYITKSFTYAGERYFVRGTSEAEAIKKAKELRTQLEKGEIVKQNESKRTLTARNTVKELTEMYLNTYIKPKVREPGKEKTKGSITKKSYNMYKSQFDVYINSAIGNKRIGDIRKSDLQKILNDQKEKGVSFSTSAKTRLVLNATFGQAVDEGIIENNPASKLSVYCEKGEERRSLTEEEQLIMIKTSYSKNISESNIYNTNMGIWFRTLLLTGLRPGEAAALKVKNIDFNARTIRVVESIEAGTEKIIAAPKTKHSIRKIGIPDICYDDLLQTCTNKSSEDYVFTQKDGKSMMTSTSIKRSWQSFYRLMDIEAGAKLDKKGHVCKHAIAQDLVLYDLRHTKATEMVKSGCTPDEVQRQLGHADISTSLKYYIDKDQLDPNVIQRKSDERDRELIRKCLIAVGDK